MAPGSDGADYDAATAGPAGADAADEADTSPVAGTAPVGGTSPVADAPQAADPDDNTDTEFENYCNTLRSIAVEPPGEALDTLTTDLTEVQAWYCEIYWYLQVSVPSAVDCDVLTIEITEFSVPRRLLALHSDKRMRSRAPHEIYHRRDHPALLLHHTGTLATVDRHLGAGKHQ